MMNVEKEISTANPRLHDLRIKIGPNSEQIVIKPSPLSSQRRIVAKMAPNTETHKTSINVNRMGKSIESNSANQAKKGRHAKKTLQDLYQKLKKDSTVVSSNNHSQTPSSNSLKPNAGHELSINDSMSATKK